MIRPNGHPPLLKFSPMILIFVDSLVHFDLVFNVGIYSFSHRLQKASMLYCAMFHFFLHISSFDENTPDDDTCPLEPNSKWFGVILMWL
jgi:hypothetical protein